MEEASETDVAGTSQMQVRTNSSCSEGNNSDAESCTNSTEDLPTILNGTFFQIISSTEKTVRARCLKCPTSQKSVFSGSLKATSNFLLHFKKHHKDFMPEYESMKAVSLHKTKKKRRKRSGPAVISTKAPKKKQLTIVAAAAKRVERDAQEAIDKSIVRYIVQSMSPLSTVELPEFRDLVFDITEAVGGQRPSVMSRKTLKSKVKAAYDASITATKDTLKDRQGVCLTADIWSAHHKAYMGITSHWINDDLTRGSAPLACRRFRGSHTYDKIADLIIDVMKEFNLSTRQVTAVVTDNGSNFVKAFKEYGIAFKEKRTSEAEEGEEEDDLEDEADAFDFQEMEGTLDAVDQVTNLPPHQRCATHTLSLLATKDVAKVLKNCGRFATTSFAKATAIWNAVARSPKASDAIEELVGRHLITPNATRWNSLYDSLECLLPLKPRLQEICQALAVVELRDGEVSFLEEYFSVLRPVAISLDKLQGEEDTFIGCLLPTLQIVQKQLRGLHESDKLKQCKPIAKALIEGLKTRFDKAHNDEELHQFLSIATVSHPFFKLRWVKEEAMREKLKQAFVKEAERHTSSVPAISSRPEVTESDNFFDFEEPEDADVQDLTSSQPSSQPCSGVTAAEVECLKYLSDNGEDSKRLQSLHRYPIVKAVFMSTNAVLPSSAPVERLFSYAKMILRPHRARLGDRLFEQLLMLKTGR